MVHGYRTGFFQPVVGLPTRYLRTHRIVFPALFALFKVCEITVFVLNTLSDACYFFLSTDDLCRFVRTTKLKSAFGLRAVSN